MLAGNLVYFVGIKGFGGNYFVLKTDDRENILETC
jgi:hypothetical protein